MRGPLSPCCASFSCALEHGQEVTLLVNCQPRQSRASYLYVDSDGTLPPWALRSHDWLLYARHFLHLRALVRFDIFTYRSKLIRP